MLSTDDKVFVPELYFSRDKVACDLLVDNVRHQESCAAISMPDNGKNYLFINVVKRLENEKLIHTLHVRKLFSNDDLQQLLVVMKSTTTPTAYILYIDMATDISWFIHELSGLRKLKGHAFITCLFCHVGNAWEALLNSESAVMHAQIPLKPVSFEDATRYIEIDSARFGFQPDALQKQDIYRWSYGHVGLVKTLMLLKRQHPAVPFTANFLLDQAPVVERLQKIINDLPSDQKRLLMLGKLKPEVQRLLEHFGYLDKRGDLFHPLLAPLIAASSPQANATLSLTEGRVFDYLRRHPAVIISRDDVARIIWGNEEWEDKYSDWAIGQLIYRLRKKLEYGSAPGTIETHKGRGFLYRTTTAS